MGTRSQCTATGQPGPGRSHLARSRPFQGLVALIVAIVPFVVTIPSASAALGFSVSQTFQSPVAVTQTGVPAFLTITNQSTAPESGGNITVNSITLVPACGTSSATAGGDCPAASADPGVLVLSSTGVGQTTTACAGVTFNISVVDASTSEYSFSPVGPMVALSPPSGPTSTCTIDFTFSVNKMPAHPTGGSGNSLQTDAIEQATATSQVDGATASATAVLTLTVDKATPTLTTMASNSVTLGSQISDSAVVAGGAAPTGFVTFSLFGPGNATCTGTPIFTSLVQVTGNGTYSSGNFTPSAAGSYNFLASYGGDSNNAAFMSNCGAASETTTVTTGNTALATNASATVPVGGVIFDRGTLSGGVSPTGSIIFNAFGPGNPTCSGTATFTSLVTVSGNGTYQSTNYTTSQAGTYQFVATYSGDANNNAAASACGAAGESVVVSSAHPTLATTASASTVAEGSAISDSATLSGGVSPTGTITFSLFGPNNATCSGSPAFVSTISVNAGNGVYPSNPFTTSSPGTYRWVASYSGDANNAAAATSCGDPAETTTVTSAAGSYTPVHPARDLDTRNNTGGTAGPVAGNHTFNLTVTGVNGVPATGVGAVALNVTVTSPTCAAWLTVFPAGQAIPSSSNLNYVAGQTIANFVVVAVGTAGQVSFNVPAACTGTIQVLADIQGWYAA